MPSGRRALRLPVATTVLTGALAAGKTTYIASLIQQKPPGETWAVLLNEFGAAGLDAALLEGGASATAGDGDSGGSAAPAAAPSRGGSGEGVHIRQLAGGCLCCALSCMTPLAVVQLLRTARPDRLLIEPSGLAHPAVLLDMLQGGHLGASLALHPVVCLVDITQFAGGAAQPACCANQLLADQISIADVVVGSKADLADEVALRAFHHWAQQLFPPKQLVVTARHGQVDDVAGTSGGAASLLAWLDHAGGSRCSAAADGGSSSSSGGVGSSGGSSSSSSSFISSRADVGPVQRVKRSTAGATWLSSSASDGACAWGTGSYAAAAQEAAPEPGQPLRREVQGGDGAHVACGWVFHRDCLFSRPRLLRLLQLLVPRALRVKGVFRVAPSTWAAMSAAPDGTAVAAPRGEAERCGPSAGSGSDGGGVGSASGGSSTCVPPVELREVAYRRDSRVELILAVVQVAAGAASASAGRPPVASAAAAADPAAAAAAADFAAAAGTAHAAGMPPAAEGGRSLEQELSQLALAAHACASLEAAPLEQQAAAALIRAAAGDWALLEALLLGTLVTAAES